MADRYWVGGAGTWDTTSTAKWSATSGGASGASVPTAADNVFFNSSSGIAGTVTMTGALACLSISVTVTGWIFSSTGTLAISGSMSLSSVTTWSATGAITFNSTSTGNTIIMGIGSTIAAPIIFNGIGGYWTLGSAFTTTSNLTLTAGTFDTSTSNHALTVGGGSGIAISANSNTKAMILNASSVSTPSLNNSSTGNLTFNSGTSTITLGVGYTGGTLITTTALTLYNVILNSTALFAYISGSFTFNNLTFYPSTASNYKVHQVFLVSSITVNGTLYSASASGTDAAVRVLFVSYYKGTPVTITAAAVSLYDTDFDDIIGAGAATWTGTRLGNCGGNSNITFPSAKTVYYSSTALDNYWSEAKWATTSGGTGASTNFPLPQDTVIIDDNSNSSSGFGTFYIDADYTIGTLDASSRTRSLNLHSSAYDVTQYGGGSRFLSNFTIPSNVTLGGAGYFSFNGRSTQVITTNSATITAGMTFFSSGTIQLANNITTIAPVTLYSGTLDLNNKVLTISRITMSSPLAKTIAFGSNSTIVVTGNGSQAWYNNSSSTLNVTGTGTISMTSASSKTFSNALACNYTNITLDQGGAGTLGISPAGSLLYDISNSYSATGATVIQSIGTLNLTRFTATGSAGKVLTLQLGRFVCPSGVISVDYMNIAGNTGQGGAKWYAGANSTNGGSNRGWIFTAPPSNNFMFLLLGS